tara:strand:+ start:286 stop:669 length:384 start_codon:yes stop_codon:yes gene_type:complete
MNKAFALNLLMDNRLEHIKLLERSLLNDTRGVSKGEVELISNVIDVLQFVSSSEYQQLYETFKEKDKESFMVELTEFLINDKRWSKIANKRRKEFEELKKIYIQKENRDFNISEYMLLLESAIIKQN